MQNSHLVPSPGISKMEKATGQSCFQISRAIFKRSSKGMAKLSTFIKMIYPASWGLLSPLLFLAKAVTCWSRVGLLHSKAHLHISGALLQATSICFGMPPKHWGRCLASSAAGSAMTNWNWLFWWGRAISQGQLSFLYRNDSSTSYPHSQWGLFVSGVLDPDQVWSALG